jgi:phosphoribosyl-ATP pyrophosphohydrolase
MTIDELFQIIHDRKEHPVDGSYTNYLFEKGEDEILKKVGEEAMEIILAAKSQGNHRLVAEVADLTYHLLVLLEERGLTPQSVRDELGRRHRPR